MLLTALLCLTISNVAPRGESGESPNDSDDSGDALEALGCPPAGVLGLVGGIPLPSAPEWSEGLPDPLKAANGATTLPEALAHEVSCRMLHLDAIPGLCLNAARRIDSLRLLELKKSTKVCEASCRRRIVEVQADAARGWPEWAVALLGVGAVVVGAAIGYLAAPGG